VVDLVPALDAAGRELPRLPARPAPTAAAMTDLYKLYKHWHATANWVDRVLPWPTPPAGISDHRAWEVYYQQKADVASSRVALALLAIEAVIEDWRLYGSTNGPVDVEIALLEKVRRHLAETPPVSEPAARPRPYRWTILDDEPATGLAQGAAADPASIPESNAKGVYP